MWKIILVLVLVLKLLLMLKFVGDVAVGNVGVGGDAEVEGSVRNFIDFLFERCSLP